VVPYFNICFNRRDRGDKALQSERCLKKVVEEIFLLGTARLCADGIIFPLN